MTDSTQPEPWTDERIREAFIDDGGQAEFYDPIHGAQTQRRVAGEIFDRWLAAREARIRAEREPVVVDDATLTTVREMRADSGRHSAHEIAALDLVLAALTPDGQETDRG